MANLRVKAILLIFFLVLVFAANLPFCLAVSWSPEMRLTTYPSTDILSSITQTSDGRVWVLWQCKRINENGQDVYYKTYNFTGWSKDLRLIYDLGEDINPCLIQLQNQTLFLTWASNRYGNYEIFYKTSTNNGLSWTDPMRLTDYSEEDTNPAVVQLRNGSIWLVWRRRIVDNDEIFYRLYQGSSWGNEVQFTNTNALDRMPSIMQASDNRVWIFWDSTPWGGENTEIFYRIYDGSSWTGDFQLTTSSYLDADPSVVQTRDGAIWVVWYAHDPSLSNFQDDLFYKNSTNNGATWSSTMQLTYNSTNDRWPATAQINDKKLWVVWSGNTADINYDIYYKTSDQLLFHDVAVADIALSDDSVYQGVDVSIDVTAQNHGDFTEILTVDCYANATWIGNQVISLPSGGSTLLVFPWETSTFSPGRYYVNVTVAPVPNENIINLNDNTLISDPMLLRILGDINADGRVDADDLSSLSAALGSAPGQPKWNEECDLDGNSLVDVTDLYTLSLNYGRTI